MRMLVKSTCRQANSHRVQLFISIHREDKHIKEKIWTMFPMFVQGIPLWGSACMSVLGGRRNKAADEVQYHVHVSFGLCMAHTGQSRRQMQHCQRVVAQKSSDEHCYFQSSSANEGDVSEIREGENTFYGHP